MSRRLAKNIDVLRVLNKCKPCQIKAFLSKSDPNLFKCIYDICHNYLVGNIPISLKEKKRLGSHKNLIRYLGTKRVTLRKKKSKIIQKGGFLSVLLTPILTAIATELIEDLIEK